MLEPIIFACEAVHEKRGAKYKYTRHTPTIGVCATTTPCSRHYRQESGIKFPKPSPGVSYIPSHTAHHETLRTKKTLNMTWNTSSHRQAKQKTVQNRTAKGTRTNGHPLLLLLLLRYYSWHSNQHLTGKQIQLNTKPRLVFSYPALNNNTAIWTWRRDPVLLVPVVWDHGSIETRRARDGGIAGKGEQTCRWINSVENELCWFWTPSPLKELDAVILLYASSTMNAACVFGLT